MLVNNKFIYLSLPRCASTTFMLQCIKDTRISIQHYHSVLDDLVKEIDLTQDDMTIIRTLPHAHEAIDLLEEKFGNHYDVVAVRRDRHERFISLYNHCIQLVDSVDKPSADILRSLTIDDILFFKSNDISARLSESDTKEKIVDVFIQKNNLKNDIQIKQWLVILFTPHSHYHFHYSKIKWFDFDKIHELEEWVSNKLGFEFKLQKINTSKHIESNLKLDDNFIKKYNSVYDRFDLPKTNKTFL